MAKSLLKSLDEYFNNKKEQKPEKKYAALINNIKVRRSKKPVQEKIDLDTLRRVA